MFYQMIKNSIIRSKGQKFLTFLTIFLSVALITCMLNITLNIGNKVADELRSYGSNIVVLPKSSALNIEISGRNFLPLESEDYLAEKDLHQIKEIFWQNNIVAFAPFLEISADFGGENLQILGTYFDKNINLKDDPKFKTGVESLYPFWVIEGKYPKDSSLDEIIIGEKLANAKNFKIGDMLEIEYENSYANVKIVGILKGSDNEANKIIAPLNFVQNLAKKPDVFSKAEVSAMTIPENDLSVKARRNVDSLDALEYDTWYCSAYVGSIAYQIEENFPNSVAKAVLSVSETQSEITKKIQNLMSVVSILALIVSALCVTSLTSSEIYRRKKEIGLLKALGAKNSFIFIQFCTENLAVGLISSVFGVIFGYLISFLIGFQLFSSFIGISFMTTPLSVIFGLFICVLGSIFALKNALNLLPVEVLYGRK